MRPKAVSNRLCIMQPIPKMSDSQVKRALQQKRQTDDPFCVHHERRPNFASFSLLDANHWRQRSLGRLDGEEEDSEAHRGSTMARAGARVKADEGGCSRALEATAGHNRLTEANPRPTNDNDDDEERATSRTARSNRARSSPDRARGFPDLRRAAGEERPDAARRATLGWATFCVRLLERGSFWVYDLCAWEAQTDKCLFNLGADCWRQSKDCEKNIFVVPHTYINIL
jgi:hypothetical protein